MGGKFVILNNGLRDHCGHYYETSISLAEAARRNGWHPILATHADCPASLLPEWLESYAIFCTDHWMAGPPAEPPDLGDFGPFPYQTPHVTIDAVRRGDSTIRDFISSRFNSLPAVASNPQQTGRAAERFFATYGNLVWCIERTGFYLFPPFLYSALRKLAWWTVPRCFVPGYHPRIRERLGEMVLGTGQRHAASVIDDGPCGPEVARALANEAESDWVREALFKLRSQDLAHELEYALIFKRDLERLLTLGQLGAGDHVLLGTAHARELLAVFLVCRQLEADRRPTFHLEFRHPLFRSQVTSEELISSPVVKLHRTFLSLYEKWGPLEAIRFYTDTRQLSEDFNLLGTTRFGVLPIPFRSELIAPPCHSSGEPLQLVFLGQARDEKGFPWLPDLVDDLDADYVRTGKVRFSIQANLGAPQYNPRSAGALARLKQCPHKVVELLGLDAPLTPGEYYRLVSRANIVLLPYDRDRYRAASSGTLADAIAGGRPVVVPSRGWMAGQLPHGAGETFDDYESFVSAVRRVIDNYESYAATALRGRSDWLVQHTPDALLSAVTTRSQSVRHAPRAA